MYLDFFKLHLKPFQISTDPRFLWLGEKHREALAVLKYGILDNKGFLLLTGDVGTGKTTLLNALIDSLGEDVLVAMVADPGLAKMDFFNFIADSFGMYKTFKSKGEFLIFLKNYLLDLNQQNKQALLIIDECQHLNQKLLEEVRLLSNIEKSHTKLINIFFVGQSEFNNIILRPHNRAIRQRITINYNISALSEAETGEYIRFRLNVAGSEVPIFTSKAIKEVYQFSNGYPRLINIICDQALLTGFVREKRHVDEIIIAECASELKIPHGTTIADSDATPESHFEEPATRSEAPQPRLGKRDEAFRLKKTIAAWLPDLQMKTPLVMALIVVLIIWMGLVATFIFNRQRSDATNNAMDKQSAPETTVAPETPNAAPDPSSNAGDMTKSAEPRPAANGQVEPKGTLDNANTVKPPNPPAAANSPAVENASSGAGQTHATTASDIRKGAEAPISRADIHRRYGPYPEVHFEFNSNNLDGAAYEMLGVVAQFCLQNPETIVILRGYTDTTGVRAYNLRLSEYRASMVKTYLIGRGVKDEAITMMAIGPDQEGPGGTTVATDAPRRKVSIEIISPTG